MRRRRRRACGPPRTDFPVWVVLSVMASIIMCVPMVSSSSSTVSAYVGVSSSPSFHTNGVVHPRGQRNAFVAPTFRSTTPRNQRGHHHPYHHGSTMTTTTTTTTLYGSGNNKKSEPTSSSSSSTTTTSPIWWAQVGLLAQPIVWISLFCVSTTGGGLPEGPYGLVGALEGLSYLTVVGWAAAALLGNQQPQPLAAPAEVTLSKRLSLFTIGIGLWVLVQLVTDQGCVPNAKPILDYSAYVNVCDAQQTPGFFGGGL